MKKRFLSMVLSLLMIVSMVPMSLFPVFADPAAQAANNVVQNTDQNKGVVFAKSAQPHLDEHGNPDGTVDIVLHAYTTGVVTRSENAVPTDIVLVLDLSGSMDDAQSSTQITTYTPVYATETIEQSFWGSSYHTGLNTTQTRYVMTAPNTYAAATRSSDDDNGHEVWYYGSRTNRTYFYPAFENSNVVLEKPYENTSYPVIQVYTQSTQTIQGQKKIDLLKQAVDEFIANTAAYNEGITDMSKMHRISIVKFASNQYANSNNLLQEGNGTYRSGGNTYNYSQVVKNLTVVDAAGKTALINAMDSLNPGGATAVDYGMNLANAVFDAQSEATMQGRKKVVIVLTDGSPTYSNSYQAAVAGSAINYSKTLKDEGVTVYSISVEAGADATQLGTSDSNKFMHYMSSNYPNASYANSTITAGTGSPTAGYYLTPDGTHSLDMIFTKISEDIASPTISLGAETAVVDSISEYFTITDPINKIDVYTSDKLAGNAWADPVKANLTPTVSGNTVAVSGFDFNANFVSSEKRVVDGKDFWGRTLILVINVTPDYDKIDIHAADIATAGGAVETNEGVAEVVKDNNVITTVSSPTIQLNKITYTVDGTTYDELYRLPGGEHTVIAAPTKTGATFSGWTSQTTGVDISTGAFIMPQSDVAIAGTFTNIDYTVSYAYVGLDLGAAMPALPQPHTAQYGDNVTVAATPTLTGYDFVGWYPQDEALGTGNITAFSMPAHDVALLGRFVPSTGTAYRVEHYTETFTDGQFELKDHEDLNGTTGETATAVPKNYEGFTFDDTVNGTKVSAAILADGSLVLKLYYTRNSYEVTYEYVGDKVPTGANPAGVIGTPIASYTLTYKYGEDVTVKADATAPGYTFIGWYSTGGTVTTDTVSFKMPDHAVTLHGYFSANTNTKYTVEHYFENVNDNGYTINNALTEEFNNATTDTTVNAVPLNIQGFKCDTTVAGTVESGVVNGNGTLTLKLYYKRNTYEVTYEYVGDTVPTGANPAGVIGTPIAGYTETYKYGEDVTVKADAAAPGYTFTGWYSTGGTVANDTVSFKMPDHAVTLHGYFSANTNTKYTVEHYFENANDDGYTINNALTEVFNNATTDTTVNAVPLNIQGFKCDTTVAGTLESGVVNGNGTLTLKLYYKRNTYKVVYDYEGFVPADADPSKAELADFTATYKWGQTVTVRNAVNDPTGYEFHGWYKSGDASRNIISGTTFEMPQSDVLILGHFDDITGIEYYVNHYFWDADANAYVHDATHDETFKGTSGETVTATPVSVTGYHHNASYKPEKASGVVPGPHDGTVLTLELYYDLNEYEVSYKYEGVVPTDASALPANGVYLFGEEVTVAGAATAKGYTFVGWYRNNDTSKTPVTKFDMPANNVELVGMFVANTDTGYTVEHYFEDVNGNYVIDNSKTESLTGTTGTSVTAIPLGVLGYTYNVAKSAATRSGTIAGDGSTTLKLYYDLNEYTVTYKYEGVAPAGASALPANGVYHFGEEVTVAGAATAKGYTFVGWYRNNDAGKTPVTKFDMPAHNVELVGMFVANTDTAYTVEHYFEDVNGNYVIDDSKTESLTGTTGTSVTATPIGVDGFTYNVTKSAATRSDTIAGDGSTTLKLYYSRNKFTVTYVYTVAPAGTALPTPHIDVPWGVEVTLKDAADVTGYTFSGWEIKDVTIIGGKFTMPKGNVTVVGSYSANDYNYKVEHWVETDRGFELHGVSEVRVGKMDAAVTAATHVIHGYTYDADLTVTENANKGIEIGDGKDIKFANSDRTVLRSVIKDGNLVLAFYYTRNEYDVSYVIKGAVKPEGVTAPTKQTDVPFGTTVDVADAFNIPGYTFSGWTTEDVAVDNGQFSMPDNDVVFVGSFTADSVSYKIKYWHESLNAVGEKEYGGKQYDEVTADEETLNAITGHAVSAFPKYLKTYEGLMARPDQTEYYGNVKGDGSLVLNVYYDRMTFDVTYIYVGLQPDDAPAIPASYSKTDVMYGAVLDVEAKMDDYSDRKFDGWHSTDVDITNNATNFTMPAKNVTIYGKYVPADPNDYTVTYFVDGVQYAQYVMKPGEVHLIIDEPVGETTFGGWSAPKNVVEGTYFATTDKEFIMPWSDVEIHGEFAANIGTLAISKQVNAPEGFTGPDKYTFELYWIHNGDSILFGTVTVKAGSIEFLPLTCGTYFIKEKDAEVEGYELMTDCNYSDGIVEVNYNEETTVVFTNTYSKSLLQMDDHFAYIVGYPDGTVRPEASITRAEVATIFFRMMTDDARNHYWSTTNTFSDVTEDAWYNVAISTLANAGVLNGYTDGTFHPNATITRAELVKIAMSFYDTAAGQSSEFSDVTNHWAGRFIDEAQKLGIVDGYGDGTFHPDQAVTRAETMKIVNRTLNRKPDKDHLLDSMIKWPDNMDTGKWYYAEVQEATNSHDYTDEGDYEAWTAILPVRDWARLERAWKDEHEDE